VDGISKEKPDACRLGAVVSAAHPSNRPGLRIDSDANFGVGPSFAGGSDIVGKTASQDAEALRQWQGRGKCGLSSRIGSSEASGVPG